MSRLAAEGLRKALAIVDQEIRFQTQGTDVYQKCLQIRHQIEKELWCPDCIQVLEQCTCEQVTAYVTRDARK